MDKVSVGVVPEHLGLIMDGNRTWARAHGVPVQEGYRQGWRTLKTITRSAMRHGVRYISAFVFSTENWQRDQREVRDLLKLFTWVAKHELQELGREDIRLRVVGSKLKLGAALAKALHDAEEATKHNSRATLLVCLDYGGQQEIVEAVKRIAASGIDAEDITPELISHHLYAPDVPPLDLIIRTSGQQRLSNFMLWEAAYSELAFIKMYWPDFDEAALGKVLHKYSLTERRFGG